MGISIVLLSGGIDSAVALAVEQGLEREPIALTVDYGQSHRREVDAARKIAKHFGAEHVVVPIDLGFATSRLLDGSDDAIRTLEEIRRDVVSPMYVPARNTILISLALALADSLPGPVDRIVLGANSGDSAFPDCQPEFVAAAGKMAALGTVSKPDVVAPFAHRSKSNLIWEGHLLGVPFAKTVSCYSARTDLLACGRCDACLLRKEAFCETGLVDPLFYLVDW